MAIDPEILKSTMRNWVSGVAVITSSFGGESHGMTVNSFTSVSIQPPLIVVTLANQTRTCILVKQSLKFGVTILSDQQREISDRFAGIISEDQDRFSGLQVSYLNSEIPFLGGGLAWLECVVVNQIDLGFSTLFLAEVLDTRISGGEPLLYHNRDYYRLGEKYE